MLEPENITLAFYFLTFHSRLAEFTQQITNLSIFPLIDSIKYNKEEKKLRKNLLKKSKRFHRFNLKTNTCENNQKGV